MPTLFLDDTEWDILLPFSDLSNLAYRQCMDLVSINLLCGECLVVHEEKVNVVGVVDYESFVARGHKMAGFSVRTVSDLITRHLLASKTK